MMISNMLSIVFIASISAETSGKIESRYLLPAVPDGYHELMCDDCGVTDRQPHVEADCGIHTYDKKDVNAPLKSRTVACGINKITVRYDALDLSASYAVNVGYANEPFNNRVQSLWAADVQLHPAHELPKGKDEWLAFSIPAESIKNGKLVLEFRREAGVNTVVSAVELWSTAPARKELIISDVFGLNSDLTGVVSDLCYAPVAGADVAVMRMNDDRPVLKVQSDKDGKFVFKRDQLNAEGPPGDVRLVASQGELRKELTLPRDSLVFEPIKYRPIPARVAGLSEHQQSLDGIWRIRAKDAKSAKEQPLEAAGWGDFKVPGQWVQQGYDIPQDQFAAIGRSFSVPAEWKDYRIFLRFDSIHAGTRYWVNGKELGYSENLFTPVEWEITDAVHGGESNRIDLLMKVDTPSERLSYSSGYAFHSLGGIDRSARIYALPRTHVRSMRVLTDLDKDYRDAQIKLDIGVDDGKPHADGLEAVAMVLDKHDKEVGRGAAQVSGSEKPVQIEFNVSDPQKWSDEKPQIYTLAIELKHGADVLERIERQIGFRKIEVRGRQLYVNNHRIKLLGACRHETDPLTGRADTMQHAETDLKLMKEANLNFVRTSHYPPPIEVLDAADRLGLYVEVEAPFCWVHDDGNTALTPQVLTPTTAMVDYCHTHPSILDWSLANESAFARFFEISGQLVKQLDPTRPTTFNDRDPKKICDIANWHYPPMPYDKVVKDETRPALFGEYFFPICHEQTDVRIDPGLRELWTAGHSEPDSQRAKELAKIHEKAVYLTPAVPPSTMAHIYRSESVVGGAIWAFLDEPFFLPNGKKAGYYWIHGPWGLIDSWRRPKPEWWLAKLLFSRVWFPTRHVQWSPGQASIQLPVENRYAFTNLSDLTIAWECAGQKGEIKADVAPATTSKLEIPVPGNAKASDVIALRITDAAGMLVNILPVSLGEREHVTPPQPKAGAPELAEKDGLAVISGQKFALVLDKNAAELKPEDSRHQSALLRRPGLHVTRFDFGDLRGDLPPYAVMEDQGKHQIEQVQIEKDDQALAIIIRDRYDVFEGSTQWLIDRDGMCEIQIDYAYTGNKELYVREIGTRMAVRPECQTLSWRRWSEWGFYPEDSISRVEGKAIAHRDAKWPLVAENVRPSWPWSQDETELGTTDFRSIKLNIYNASLTDSSGNGVTIHADADAHMRACLSDGMVMLHVLSNCKMGPVTLKKGDHVTGKFYVQLGN